MKSFSSKAVRLREIGHDHGMQEYVQFLFIVLFSASIVVVSIEERHHFFREFGKGGFHFPQKPMVQFATVLCTIKTVTNIGA